jgi:ABC-2 type transport system permease protein
MLRDPFTKWLWDGRRSLLGWIVAIVVVGGLYAAFWPTIDDPALQAALESYPEAMLEALNYTDLATTAGYLTATVYGLVVAVLMIVFAIGAGSRMIAGDEEAGILDLILAHPVSRYRLALLRFGAFLAAVGVMVAALWLAMIALTGPARFEGITAAGFAAMHLHLWLFTGLFGAVAFAVGAATGRKTLAIAIGATFAVWGFLANGVLPQVEGLEWTRNLSPFDWLIGETPLANGVRIGAVLTMAGLVLLLVGAGTWRFGRRDVAV